MDFHGPIIISSWPSAILHLDADAFFASVEQALNPQLRGKPVITGAERGIVAAASYEAKRRGVTRAMRLAEAKKICPGLICLPSDYETYAIFSKRIFVIMRRFTPVVEEYSIDEAFADLSGLRRLHHTSFGGIAQKIKAAVEAELGITVSVGLSLTKSLAKLCSKLRKPSGLVIMPGRQLHELLAMTSLDQVWGFGSNTVALLQKYGLHTAWDYVRQPEDFAKKILGKIGLEIHRELLGRVVYPVQAADKTSYVTIAKVKTFTPASQDKNFVYAQALKNLENACIKARRYKLSAKCLSLFLRTQRFENLGLRVKLQRPSAATHDLTQPLHILFGCIYKSGVHYRATGVVLGDLEVVCETQLNFFEDPLHVIQNEQVAHAIDCVNAKFGKHKIHLAGSLSAQGLRGILGTNHGATLPGRKQHRLKGENFRQHLGMPVLKT